MVRKLDSGVLQELKIYQSNGWDVKDETPEYILLKRNTNTITGHILIGIFFGWWTLGFANFLYWLSGRKKKKIIK